MKITQSSSYYVEGKENDLTKFTLNELFDQKKMTKLSYADYFYKNFYLAWTEYDAAQTFLGEDTGNPIKNYTSYSPVEVWVRKNGQSTFEKYAEVKRGKDGAYIATDTNGQPLATSGGVLQTFWVLPNDVAERTVEWILRVAEQVTKSSSNASTLIRGHSMIFCRKTPMLIRRRQS